MPAEAVDSTMLVGYRVMEVAPRIRPLVGSDRVVAVLYLSYLTSKSLEPMSHC